MVRWLLPLPLALLTTLGLGARAVEPLAEVIVEPLVRLAPLLAPPAPARDEDPIVAPEATVDEVLAAVPAPSMAKPAKVALQGPAPPAFVYVPAEQVLALADSGARPRGRAVPATASRPAGLLLSGVSGLSIGVLDGDVLTDAGGVPAHDAGAVIEMVLRARARHAGSIGGTLFRGAQRYHLVVEQPYLPAPATVPGADPPPP
jgi:hypothetical protein